MDPSATRPIQQRYTAGGCVLDVTMQPSALTQWYPRTVAQTLTFRLWLATSPQMETPEPTSQTLVAEGDRDTLQAITRYIAQQTRHALVVAPSKGQGPSPLAPCPPDLHVQLPLSYLQLCDLTAVFNQVEQAARLLPVSLRSSDAVSGSKGRLIAFPTNRKLWASSAAAALFAVGLTTALWPRDSTQDAAIVSDAVRESAPTAESAPRQNAATQPEDAPAPQPVPDPSESVAVNPPDIPPTPSVDSPLGATPRPSADVRPPAASLPSPSPEDLTVPAEEAQSPEPPASAEAGAQPQRAAQLETQSETQAEAQTEADRPAADSADTSPSIRPSQPAARRSTAEALSENAQVENSQTDPAAVQTAETDILIQVQQYFQAQWQNSPQAVQLPLAYDLQLSESGEVMRFTGIGEAAQTFGDRLLPSTPPTFALSAEEAVTLRVTITAEGIVQVSRR